MSELNLIPNPRVLATNTAIFLVNLVVMKKLFMDPYLAMRDKRHALTGKQHGTAAGLLVESESLERQIKSQMAQALDIARTIRAESKARASAKRDETIQAAEASAKRTIADAHATMAAVLKHEQEKLPQLIGQLASAVYGVTVS